MRVFVSILLLAILVVITPVLLLVTAVKTNILQTTFLKHELERNDVYTMAFSVVDSQIQQIEIPSEFPVAHEEIATLVKKVFTPDWLQENVEGALDSFDGWLNAPAGTELSVPVSLAEPKAALVAELDLFLTDKLTTLEPCSDPKVRDDEEGICQFAGMGLDAAKEELKRNGIDPDLITNLLPDTIDLINPDLSKITGSAETDNSGDAAVKTAEVKQNLERVKSYYQLGQRFFWYAWILYGVLVAEYLVLNGTKGWRRLVRWTGVLFLSVGSVPTALAIVSVLVVQQVVLPQIQIDPKFPTEVAALVPVLVADVRQAIFTLPLVVGLILVAAGLASVIGSHWIPKPIAAKKDLKGSATPAPR